MSLRHPSAIRLAAACLLFTVALTMVPEADIPETQFDEANTATNEMIVARTAASGEFLQPTTTLVARVFVQPQGISLRRILLNMQSND